MSWNRRLRKIHSWGAIGIAVPLIIVIVSGLMLQVKKQVLWVQPATMRGQGTAPSLSFEAILKIAQTVPEANLSGWKDIDRLDVRPKKGVVKIRAKNRWEIQLDHQTGDVLQVAYRRSDLIEAIHDGSFFHNQAKSGGSFPRQSCCWYSGLQGYICSFFPWGLKDEERKKKCKLSTSPLKHRGCITFLPFSEQHKNSPSLMPGRSLRP